MSPYMICVLHIEASLYIPASETNALTTKRLLTNEVDTVK